MISPSIVFSGYSGALWQAVYKGLASYQTMLSSFSTGASGAPSLSDVFNASQGMYDTMLNGTEAINVYAMSNAWRTEINALQQIQALPLVLDPTTEFFVNNRIASYESAQSALSELVPEPPYGTFQGTLSQTPIVPSPGLLNFFSTFSFEVTPSGLTGANLIAEAQACATAFQTLAQAISTFQGSNITQLYDVAIREYQCAQSVVNLLSSYTSNLASGSVGIEEFIIGISPIGGQTEVFEPDVIFTNAWNQLVALPAMTMSADTITSAAFTVQLQQQAVLRYAMLKSADSISALLLSLRQPLTAQISLTTVRNNDSLPDIASRTLGDFELWPEIATLNGLTPPYIAQDPSPGIVGWGQQLLLPTPGTTPSVLGIIPSYTRNFLGTDLYVGPINGSMPPWTGDFEIISGYDNLRISLGRRLQTTQGTLIYHLTYGSLIPLQVGAVQTTATAGHINAYGKSALLADPRVQSVPIARTVLNPNNDVDFKSVVQPAGFQGQAININEVISAAP